MTIDCGNPIDALGVGVTRLKALGIKGEEIATFTQLISNGYVVVTLDTQPGEFKLFPPDATVCEANEMLFP